jgi:hypothetical protein
MGRCDRNNQCIARPEHVNLESFEALAEQCRKFRNFMTAPSAISWESIRSEVLEDPAVKAEYDALAMEFDNALAHLVQILNTTNKGI